MFTCENEKAKEGSFKNSGLEAVGPQMRVVVLKSSSPEMRLARGYHPWGCDLTWHHGSHLPTMWAWAGQMEGTVLSTDHQVYYHVLDCASLRVLVQSVAEQWSVRLDFSQTWWVVHPIRIDVIWKNKDIQYYILHVEYCHTCIGMEPYSSNTLMPHKRMAKRLAVWLCLRSKHAAAC